MCRCCLAFRTCCTFSIYSIYIASFVLSLVVSWLVDVVVVWLVEIRSLGALGPRNTWIDSYWAQYVGVWPCASRGFQIFGLISCSTEVWFGSRVGGETSIELRLLLKRSPRRIASFALTRTSWAPVERSSRRFECTIVFGLVYVCSLGRTLAQHMRARRCSSFLFVWAPEWLERLVASSVSCICTRKSCNFSKAIYTH